VIPKQQSATLGFGVDVTSQAVHLKKVKKTKGGLPNDESEEQ
jgi:hypothetical protein